MGSGGKDGTVGVESLDLLAGGNSCSCCSCLTACDNSGIGFPEGIGAGLTRSKSDESKWAIVRGGAGRLPRLVSELPCRDMGLGVIDDHGGVGRPPDDC